MGLSSAHTSNSLPFELPITLSLAEIYRGIEFEREEEESGAEK
jgi:hypothetical protein